MKSARAVYEQALVGAPKHPRVNRMVFIWPRQLRLARYQYAEGDFEAAVATYEQVAAEARAATARPRRSTPGLRRGFTLAGAQAQVVSLWKVDDASTRELMIDFYRRYAHAVAPEALRAAQLHMLRGTRKHPYHWASFLFVGAP